MKKTAKGLMITVVLLLMFNIWAFVGNTITIIKPIIIVVDLIVAYFVYARNKSKFSFLKSKPKTDDKKNFCPECGQRVDTPTCKSCGRELKP